MERCAPDHRLLVPGDFCSTTLHDNVPSSDIMETCGPARIAVLNIDLLSERARALFNDSLRLQQADLVCQLRNRLVSLGRRNARERLAYLVAETHSRLSGLGLARDGSFTRPITQEHLADTLGLTPVHTNRALKRLRNEDLLSIRRREVLILNLPGLCLAAGYEDMAGGRDRSDYDLC